MPLSLLQQSVKPPRLSNRVFQYQVRIKSIYENKSTLHETRQVPTGTTIITNEIASHQ